MRVRRNIPDRPKAWVIRGLSLVLLLISGAGTGTHQQPNLVILFTDDAGYADFGFQPGSDFETPNIDRLAASGIRFTNGYVSASVCAPSRAGLMTGRYQQRFGFEYNLPGAPDETVPDSVRGLPLFEVTLAELLQSAGYRTGLVGKWHLGLEDRFYPTRRGFDEFFGMRRGSSPYQTGLARAIETDERTIPADSLGYLTDEFGDRAVDFIRRNKNNPFFLFLSFNAPHTPMQAKPEYLEENRDAFETDVRATNAAMTRSIDENVGKVMDVLDELGLSDNTLVFFGNDNGGAMPYNGSRNTPLRGTKGTVLEGGIRVPFVLTWPTVLAANTVHSSPVSTLDLLPTFLFAAGIDLPAGRQFDGINLLPYLTGMRTGEPHSVLFWKLNWGAAVRLGDWKLVRTPADDIWLFNLARDESEEFDVASENPVVVKALLTRLDEWEATLPPPIWVSEPIWREHSLERYNQDTVRGFIRR